MSGSNPPSEADFLALQAQVTNLLNEINTLKAAAASASTSSGSSSAGGTSVATTTTTVTFADTPQTLNSDDLLDYSSKTGISTYNQGCKALEDKAIAGGFGMTPDQTVIFVEAFSRRAISMGWTQGTQQITKFTSKSGTVMDLIKCYGQIDETTLKMECDVFCDSAGVNFQKRATQNNTMMATCLSASLTADAAARLLTYRNEYTFNGVEYGPVMYKTIMRLATIDNAATSQNLRDNLNNLATYAATVNGDINKIHGYFSVNMTQLQHHGASFDDPIGALFEAYLVVPCYHFKQYIRRQHEDYLDGQFSSSFTYEVLLQRAMSKYDYLRTKGMWGAKSPEDEKIVAMSAAMLDLKSKLKLDDKLAAINKGGGKGKGGKKAKNKKNTSNKVAQKKDEAWKKVPPKDGEKKTKEVGKYTYHWCEHHMAWTIHTPSDCRLGKEHKDGQQPARATQLRANAATYAAQAATTVNPYFSSFLEGGDIGVFSDEDE